MEGGLLCLREVARDNTGDGGREGDRVDLQHCGLGKEFDSEVFLLLSGLVAGNGTWVVSVLCDKEHPVNTWLGLPGERRWGGSPAETRN